MSEKSKNKSGESQEKKKSFVPEECPVPKEIRDNIKQVSDLVRKHREIIDPFFP